MAEPDRTSNRRLLSQTEERADPRATVAERRPDGSDGAPQASRGPLIALFVAVVAAAATVVRGRGRTLPQLSALDVVLFGLAVFRLSRLITKDKVLQQLRQPFVENTAPGADGEVNSQPAGAGVRRAVGELLTCPFCVSMWLATALATAFAIIPRAARLVCAALAAVALSDAAQHAQGALRRAADAPFRPTADGRS